MSSNWLERFLDLEEGILAFKKSRYCDFSKPNVESAQEHAEELFELLTLLQESIDSRLEEFETLEEEREEADE